MEIVGVALAFIDTRTLEEDHDAGLVRPCVVFTDDAGLPQAPHVRDFLG
jgi:hypothetical protein